MKTCGIETCDRPYYAVGLCRTHRTRELHSPNGLNAEVPIGFRAARHVDLEEVTSRVHQQAAWLTAVVLVGMANAAVANP
jgi:hypothetical protein